MKRRLVELLCCPICKGELELTVFNETERAVSVQPSRTACVRRCELHGMALAEGRPGPKVDECATCYAHEINEGVLACGACRSLYPIIDCIPRLVRDAEREHGEFFARYSDRVHQLRCSAREPQRSGHNDPSVFDPRSNESFGLQWTNQSDSEKTWFKDDASLRKEEFLYSLAITPDEMRDALIFDAGCGNGRLTASLAGFGAEIVGMELSAGVEKAQAGKARYAAGREHFVHFIQGNVLELPLRSGQFDMIHSSGVLHHTPNVERAFASFLTAVRPGGRVYVQLYRRRETWVRIPNAILRLFTSRLPPPFLYRLCWAAVPLHTMFVLLVAKLRGEHSPIGSASHGERALSLFDHFSPRYQYRYRPKEMREMFEAAGLVEVQETTLENEARHMVAFVGHQPTGGAPLEQESIRSLAHADVP